MAVNFTVINADQRSPEWRRARAGRLTGSRADAILMKGKGGKDSVTRAEYQWQLVVERIDGEVQENFLWTADMQRGVELEPVAFATYEAVKGTLVRRSGFLQHTELMAGCSLDGDIENFAGIIELKCPKMATHLNYFEDITRLRKDYMAQVRHNLWITGAVYCDLVSFDDRVPPKARLLCTRVERYDADIPAYDAAARLFLDEVENKYQQLQMVPHE